MGVNASFNKANSIVEFKGSASAIPMAMKKLQDWMKSFDQESEAKLRLIKLDGSELICKLSHEVSTKDFLHDYKCALVASYHWSVASQVHFTKLFHYAFLIAGYLDYLPLDKVALLI